MQSGMQGHINSLFKERDFEDKKIVFIMAKTWGAARMFFFKTALCQFRKLRVEYLSKDQQLRGLDRKDVIVIQLPRALETERNVKCLKMAKGRNIKILDFEIPDGV
jgi:hypothetical protein